MPRLLGRRRFLATLASALAARAVSPQSPPTAGLRLAAAARAQVGVTTGYDPAYRRIPYPGGDPPRTTGVCADVVIRAARDAFHLDLQQLVHEDMQRKFTAYPRTWGMHGPDSNIDHRRVLNLETWFRRQGAQLWAAAHPASSVFPLPVQRGDELTFLLNGKLPHIAIVVQVSPAGTRIVHNIGNGAQEIDLAQLQGQPAKGHFRWPASI